MDFIIESVWREYDVEEFNIAPSFRRHLTRTHSSGYFNDFSDVPFITVNSIEELVALMDRSTSGKIIIQRETFDQGTFNVIRLYDTYVE